MNSKLLLALRVFLGIGLLGALAVQVIMILQIVIDSLERGSLTPWYLIAAGTLVVAGMACLEIVIVCVFRLLSLVAHNRVFHREAFRWVDSIAIAIGVAAVLILALGYIAAELDDAPGLIIVAFIISLLVASVALLVYVQRTLLAQAVSRDAQARALESELKGVI